MENISELTLVADVGDYAKKEACLMSAAVAKFRLEHGKPLGTATDRLACVCPVIRTLAIRINDGSWWADDAERTSSLLPFVDRILNTNNPELSVKRAMLCADRAVRVFVPTALNALGNPDEAEKLKALPAIIDKESAARGAEAARWAAEVVCKGDSTCWSAARWAAEAAEVAREAEATCRSDAFWSAAFWAARWAAEAAEVAREVNLLTLKSELLKLLSDLCEVK